MVFFLISHWILPLSRIWIFSFYLVSHWILPLSLNLYSNILFNVPLDFTSFIKLNIVLLCLSHWTLPLFH